MVLQIEGDSILAVEVAFCMEELRANIVLRKEEHYCGPDIDAEKKELIKYNEDDETGVKWNYH